MNTATNTTLRTTALLLCAALTFNQSAFAAQAPQAVPANVPAPQSPAPVPTQIATAHNVFLVNGAADPNFPIASDQAYNQIYAALQAWGHYKLVTSPDQAELILNLREISPITGVGGGDRTPAYAINSPAFQLTFTDAKTNVALWTITSPVYLAGRGQARARWTSIAITNLVSRIKVLANQPLSATESADLTNAPKYHGTRNALLFAGGAVALGVGVTLIVRNHMKNSQDAFCTAHNIPLNECPGG